MADKVLTFTDAKWNEDVLASKELVVVDFWAEWCAPCKLMAPAIEALAEEFDGRVRVGKLNVDENAQTSEKYEIRGIPTVMIFKGGQVTEQVVGVTSKENLARLIERHVK
ncbi:MAG TPA: thioredoxin [Vicinamibacteria bacterium]|jgi:thioredoxin 1